MTEREIVATAERMRCSTINSETLESLPFHLFHFLHILALMLTLSFFFHLKQRLQQALSININSFEVVLTSQLPQTMASMLTKKLNVTITFGTHMHVT